MNPTKVLEKRLNECRRAVKDSAVAIHEAEAENASLRNKYEAAIEDTVGLENNLYNYMDSVEEFCKDCALLDTADCLLCVLNKHL